MLGMSHVPQSNVTESWLICYWAMRFPPLFSTPPPLLLLLPSLHPFPPPNHHHPHHPSYWSLPSPSSLQSWFINGHPAYRRHWISKPMGIVSPLPLPLPLTLPNWIYIECFCNWIFLQSFFLGGSSFLLFSLKYIYMYIIWTIQINMLPCLFYRLFHMGGDPYLSGVKH